MTQREHNTASAGFPDASAVSDLLRRAIKRHEAAYAYFDSTCYLSDSGILHREPTADEKVVYDAASDAEANALSDVCYFPARSPADLAAKARHLRKFHCRKTDYLQDWQVENLLRSMLPEDERDQAEDDNLSLSGLIAASEKARIAIDDSGDVDPDDDPALTKLLERRCKLALAILGHRPRSTAEQRAKAEFVRDWTKDTLLNEAEQNALVASMMPEGGAA